jgi:hypothetical protein
MFSYSEGKNKFDNLPQQRKADTFKEFATNIVYSVSTKKGLTYVCAAVSCGLHKEIEKFSGKNHWRQQHLALPRRFLAFDFDGFEKPEVWEGLLDIFPWMAFLYTTASHTTEAPRARAFVELSRDVDHDEGVELGEAAQTYLETLVTSGWIQFDKSVYLSTQPIYTPVEGFVSYPIKGKVLDVDYVLTWYRAQNAIAVFNQSINVNASGLNSVLGNGTVVSSPIPSGQRNVTLLSAAGRYRAQGYTQPEIEKLVFRDNEQWCDLPIEEDEALSIARRYEHQTKVEEQHKATGPKKLPGSLKSVPVLNPEHLPTALRGAAVDIADRLQCPIDYLVVSMLSAAGAIVGNQIGIYPLSQDESWEVFPCLWGGIVGPPGSKKTPALNTALAPIKLLEEQALDRYKSAYAQYKADSDQYKSDFADWKKKESTVFPVEPTEPKQERYVVHDTTYQKLGEILAHNPRGVLALSDELSGLLQSLDSPGQEAARGFYLTGWGGNSGYSFDRIGRGSIVLPRYCLSVFGGFQPDRIKGYVKSTQNGNSKNDGLLQRFQLLVWPDLAKTIEVVDRVPNKAAIDTYNRAMMNLKLSGDKMTGAPGQKMVHFDAAAQELFLRWRQRLEKMLLDSNLDSARQSHFAKYRSLIPALALIFHLLDDHKGPVGSNSLTKAISFATYLKRHANRIYSSVSGIDHTNTNALARKLLNGDLSDGFTCRSIYVKGWMGLRSKDAAQCALDVLVENGWLSEEEIRSGGRPTVAYRINAGISEKLLSE